MRSLLSLFLRPLTFALALVTASLVSTGCPDLDSLFAECDSDSDCDDDEECNDDGECEELECTDDDDCDPGEECRSDECKRISCTTDEECGEGAFCDLVDGKCDELPTGEGEGEFGEGEGEGGEGEFGEGEGEFGEGEGEGDPCAGVSEEGQCNGDIIERCLDGFVQTANCNASPFPSGQTDCQFVNAVDRVECAVQAGSQCILNGGSNVALCQGSSPGCRLDDDSSGTCVSSAALCSASDGFQCIGNKFIVSCADETGFGNGQPLYIDCALAGGTCTPDVGCIVAPGDFCSPGLTLCGEDEFDAVICPADGVCPGGGTGTFTHSTGIPGDPTFSNDTPSNTSSQQGAIDACNAHFGVTTCGVPCPGSNCTDVTRDANCTCAPPEGLVWHFGQSACFTSADAPGIVSTIDSGCTQVDSGNWN